MPKTLPAYIQVLLDPSAYPERPEQVRLVQTHISYVFLAGAYVYKLKKPVKFAFLDFSTIQSRRRYCEEEVRLNRRLSPDIYLGVVPLTEYDGRVRMDGAGPPIDWAVKMRRLPDDRNLEQLIASRKVPDGAGRRLGEAVGRFHLSAERNASIAAIGGQAGVAANWRDNFAEARPYYGRTLDADLDAHIRANVAAFLDREQRLLADRDASGFIRDLHGDLRSAQIWILESPDDGGVHILDCIEFNQRLRFCDTASDIAFLAMDLSFRGRRDLADELLDRYLEVTGDGRLPLLLDFYCCYRAYVRGKVDSLALDEREIDATQRRRLNGRARRYFRLAERYATRPRTPRLVMLMGVAGSGKSSLARPLAARLGAAWISSDITRKQLAGVPATQALTPEQYSAEQTERTYAALLDMARNELEQGHAVVLDATFLQANRRAPVIELARTAGAPLTVVWCRARQDAIERHLQRREQDPWRTSDAGPAVFREQLAQLEPPIEVDRGAVIRVDTDRPLASLLGQIERRLRSPGPYQS